MRRVSLCYTPIIFLPPAQMCCALVWWLIWIIGAMFIVSQYSDETQPHGPFTYDVAKGTTTVPGKCTGGWPTGGIWLDEATAASYGVPPAEPKVFSERSRRSYTRYLYATTLSVLDKGKGGLFLEFSTVVHLRRQVGRTYYRIHPR